MLSLLFTLCSTYICVFVWFAKKKKQSSNLSNYLILFIMCKLHNYISRTLKFQKTTALKRRLDIKNYISSGHFPLFSVLTEIRLTDSSNTESEAVVFPRVSLDNYVMHVGPHCQHREQEQICWVLKLLRGLYSGSGIRRIMIIKMHYKHKRVSPCARLALFIAWVPSLNISAADVMRYFPL